MTIQSSGRQKNPCSDLIYYFQLNSLGNFFFDLNFIFAWHKISYASYQKVNADLELLYLVLIRFDLSCNICIVDFCIQYLVIYNDLSLTELIAFCGVL